MDITTLSFSVLEYLEENWLPKLIKLKVNREPAMQDVVLCCGKMIWDKRDAAVYVSFIAWICWGRPNYNYWIIMQQNVWKYMLNHDLLNAFMCK